MNAPLKARMFRPADTHAPEFAMVDYLRSMVVEPFDAHERFFAVYLDEKRSFIEGMPLGRGGVRALSVRMREVLGRALALDAHGLLIAHNHPSGRCRPSLRDIEATNRLTTVAKALDIALLDHLIFTQDAVYSMRAGGQL